MERTDVDKKADPGRWGHSMRNLAELVVPCLEARGTRSVTEVGAYAGDLTGWLGDWAKGVGARVVAVDPVPQPRLVELAEQREEIELVREASLEALEHVPLTDTVIIDGDHNYFTVSEELRLIGERAPQGELPLLLFHDVCWPHGRRDDYYSPDQIPADYLQPLAPGGGLHPDEPGIRAGALPYPNAAAREGGPRNGVLTAIEDFVESRDGVRLAVIPAFFGLGVAWEESAPWADAVAKVVDPWDRNPLLTRLEANRVFHLTEERVQAVRSSRQQMVLERMLMSRAFGIAELVSRIRFKLGIATTSEVVSKDEVRRALGDDLSVPLQPPPAKH